VLTSERLLAREEKPMDYRLFVTQRARAGDPGARSVLDSLVMPTHEQRRRAPRSEPHRASLNEVRARLDVIRGQEEARYERANAERDGLQRLTRPLPLDDVLANERRQIQEHTADATRFTDAERARLAQLTKEKRSWNPLTSSGAAKAEAELHAAQHSRYERATAEAMREFEKHDVPRIIQRIASHERRYQQFVAASLSLEREMNEARDVSRNRVPQVEYQVNVLERAGLSHVEVHDATPNAGLNHLVAAIDKQYRALPEPLRREVERGLRREHERNRWRESISIGDL
jgi:hypothetical protein